MAYTTSVAGTAITASWANASVRDQTVSPFTDSAARAAAITSPVDGMISVLTTTDRVDVYNGSSWSNVVAPSNGAWTAYTPVVTQSSNPTFTTNYARYQRIGRYVHGNVYLTMTGAGVAGNGVSVSLPVTAAQQFLIIGSGRIWDSSAATGYPAVLNLALTTAFTFIGAATNDANTALGALNFTAALASPDEIYAQFAYEAAADA